MSLNGIPSDVSLNLHGMKKTENGSRKGDGVLDRDAKGFLLIIINFKVRGYQNQNPDSLNKKYCFQGIIFSIGTRIFQISCGLLHPIAIYLIAIPNLTLLNSESQQNAADT